MFNALVLSLPTRNSTLRMRVWRALKDSGCAVLRDGVYLLPVETPDGVLKKLDQRPACLRGRRDVPGEHRKQRESGHGLKPYFLATELRR